MATILTNKNYYGRHITVSKVEEQTETILNVENTESLEDAEVLVKSKTSNPFVTENFKDKRMSDGNQRQSGGTRNVESDGFNFQINIKKSY